ncbi:hypothetical protein D7D52_29940 [Nocardia yunnanensis]|uniref:Uncharacterized protein n=1 Tax=Nocardia yunnanensis TaxID=2382165 RepID=A0A386ZHE4_9NOCA|nr:hypothetical protein D7D52_29940 [Nocardia yunnanensis]
MVEPSQLAGESDIDPESGRDRHTHEGIVHPTVTHAASSAQRGTSHSSSGMAIALLSTKYEGAEDFQRLYAFV